MLERPFRLWHNESMKRVVSYIRVSTQRQGASGLGLEGQRAAVEQFCRENGYELVAEVPRSGIRPQNDRPVLRQALARAKAAKAVLLIAKLDRLARNVHFISGLMEAGCEFRACDMPQANRLTVHIVAAVAEDEARRISDRTKAALAAYKARGGRLGAANPACRAVSRQDALRGAERTAALARSQRAGCCCCDRTQSERTNAARDCCRTRHARHSGSQRRDVAVRSSSTAVRAGSVTAHQAPARRCDPSHRTGGWVAAARRAKPTRATTRLFITVIESLMSTL